PFQTRRRGPLCLEKGGTKSGALPNAGCRGAGASEQRAAAVAIGVVIGLAPLARRGRANRPRASSILPSAAFRRSCRKQHLRYQPETILDKRPPKGIRRWNSSRPSSDICCCFAVEGQRRLVAH